MDEVADTGKGQPQVHEARIQMGKMADSKQAVLGAGGQNSDEGGGKPQGMGSLEPVAKIQMGRSLGCSGRCCSLQGALVPSQCASLPSFGGQLGQKQRGRKNGSIGVLGNGWDAKVKGQPPHPWSLASDPEAELLRDLWVFH